MTARPSVALIGAGAMGSNHARTLALSQRCDFSVIVDRDAVRARAVAEMYGATAATEVEAALECDAIVVVTPTQAHIDVAAQILEAGKPALVEKPLAATLADTQRLLDIAEAKDVPLQCGFVERYNPAITTGFSLMDEAPIYVKAVRHSPPAPRITTSVVSDLLIHDIDLAIRCAYSHQVEHLSGDQWTPAGTTIAETADCIVRFSDGMIANLSSSRASQRKIRYFDIGLPHQLIQIDLLRRTISVYRHVRHEMGDSGNYRAETVVDIPFVQHSGEPLALQLDHFLDVVEGKADHAAERATILAAHTVAFAVENL